MDMKAFGQRLKELRGGRSQAEIVSIIAEKTGITTTAQTLGRYERGERKPDIEIIEALAETLDVSADYLLCRTDVKTTDLTIKQMCDYTGLTERAVNTLHNLKCHTDISFPDIDLYLEKAKERKNLSKEEWNRIVEESPKLKVIEKCVATHNYENLPKEYNQALGIYVSSLDEEDIQLYTKIKSGLINACLNTLNTALESKDIYDFLRFLDVYINMDFNHKNNAFVKSYGKFFISSNDNDEHETLSTLYISDNELKLVLFEKFRIFLDSLKSNNPTYYISDISREHHATITGTLK